MELIQDLAGTQNNKQHSTDVLLLSSSSRSRSTAIYSFTAAAAAVGQATVGKDKPGAHTTFDAAAASALVEMHEYRSDGLQVRTCYLVYMRVWLVGCVWR